MKYPTEVTIRGVTYQIQYHDESLEVDCELKRELLGRINHRKRVIRIYRPQPSFDLLETLLHEVLHGVFARNQALNLALRSDEVVEPFIDALTSELSLLFIENGWITLPKQQPPATTHS